MSERENRKRQSEKRRLETRHAFLDTQVYRKLRHNPANKALRLLSDQIAKHRLVLHTTDITLKEIERQIAEDVEQTRLALIKARKDIDRWRHTVPEIKPMPELDGRTADRLFEAFRAASKDDWRATVHAASKHSPADVFADYFARRPPFDAPGSKEFPDAFVLKALEAWCAAERETMYVVTRDAATLRFAQASSNLLPLETIEDLLGAAEASADEADSEGIADALLNAPEFDHRFETAIESHVEDLIFIYDGDLPEGEVTGAEFTGVIRFVGFQIVSRTSSRVGLLIDADVELAIEIAFENRRLASYDSEDDVWIGGEWDSTIVTHDMTMELYVEMDISSGAIVKSELIRDEYRVS